MTPLLEAIGLEMRYQLGEWPGRRTMVHALRGVTLAVQAGEHLGLVGESGSGKSTLARLLLLLERASAGRVHWRGEELTTARPDRLRNWRREAQVILQDPVSALNPRLTVRAILSEPLDNFGLARGRAERQKRLENLLAQVDLSAALLERRARQLSRGQCQRVVIARALASEPSIIICDEPVSALDVEHQAQFITLLKSLAQERDLTYLLISHDMAVVMAICDRVAVLYQGRLVEMAPAATIRHHQRHPYSQLLMRSVPTLRARPPQEAALLLLDCEIPLAGCRFYPRCPLATDLCRTIEPELTEILPGHWCACHLASATS